MGRQILPKRASCSSRRISASVTFSFALEGQPLVAEHADEGARQ
jgi:hypothetical protein